LPASAVAVRLPVARADPSRRGSRAPDLSEFLASTRARCALFERSADGGRGAPLEPLLLCASQVPASRCT
jgi:hypothetical protein